MQKKNLILNNVQSQLEYLNKNMEVYIRKDIDENVSESKQKLGKLAEQSATKRGKLFSQADKKSTMTSISEYVSTIVIDGEIVLQVLVNAYILILRFIEKLESPTPINFYKLFCTSVFTSQKILLDQELWTAKDFAEIGNISEKELKSLEIEFLIFLNFSVHIGEEEFSFYWKQLSSQKSLTA